MSAGEHLSAAHVLYSRIEGILRTYYCLTHTSDKPTQEKLISSAMMQALSGRHAHCLLLLPRFEEYLKAVIFAGFDWANPIGVSRHTIGHGVVDLHQCDEKSVVIAFLSLSQLFYSIRPDKPSGLDS